MKMGLSKLKWKSRNSKLCLGAIIALILYVLYVWFLYCNDAYWLADLVKIAPQVKGYVQQIAVSDNQIVKKDQLLLQIDPTPFQLAVDEKKTLLNEGNEQLQELKITYQEHLASLKALQAQLDLANITVKRYKTLVVKQEVSQQQLDEQQTKQQVINANLQKETIAIKQANQAINVQAALVKNMQAQLASSEYQLSLTTIRAPANGFINHLRVYVGDYVNIGVPMFGLVDNDKWQIIANYKERDLADIHIGQKVLVYLPNYPWRLWLGTVNSVSHAVSRVVSNPDASLPYVEPVTDWIRYPYRFPVTITLNHPPPIITRHMGMDVKTLIIPWT